MSILNEDVKNYENKKMTLYANPTPRRKKVVNLYDCINLFFHSLLKRRTQLNSILSQVKNGSMYNSLWDQKQVWDQKCHFLSIFFRSILSSCKLFWSKSGQKLNMQNQIQFLKKS